MDDEKNQQPGTGEEQGRGQRVSDKHNSLPSAGAAIEITNLLAQLQPEQRRALEGLGTTTTVTKDEFICGLDSDNENVYFVLEGRVKIYQLTSEGKEVLLWFCSRGELFGFVESSAAPIVSGLQLSVRACRFSRLLIIKRQAFRQFLLSHPALALPIIRLLGLRLGEVIEVLSDIISSDVASRVVKLLLRLGRRYGRTVDQGLFLDIALTHQEMADMIGTSRQTVTTVLGELRRQGLIGIERRSVVIHHGNWLHQEMRGAGSPGEKVLKGRYVNSDV